MANIEILDPSEKPKAVGANGVHTEPSDGGTSRDSGSVGEVSEGHAGASPMSLSPGPTPFRVSPTSGLSSSQSGVPALSMPHPKKFTHSNINKKFLEKTSSTSPSGQTLSTSVTAKVGNSAQKPAVPAAQAHSRLVTAKLTAAPQSATTTGPGWSRPPSSVPSTAPTPPAASNSKPIAVPAPTTGHAAPQPTPIGKVIQPQPRGVSEMFVGVVKKDNINKPAWGNTKGMTPIVSNLNAAASDFPTAAEVAQGRTSKVLEKQEAAETAAAQKQAVSAEEDTFRGVHLDPNAHHWDEMEEDDDNIFLGGVIEFEDGRQYKIQPTEVTQQSSSPREPSALDANGAVASTRHPELDQPVSKEDRFADDFDRSWPRSRPSGLPYGQRDQISNGAPSSASSQSMQSPQETSRVLFNERSNRLEPYSNSIPSIRQSSTSSHFARRGSRTEFTGSPTELRGVRDVPPHVHVPGVQLLQKMTTPNDLRADGSSHSRFPENQSGPMAISPTETSRPRDRDREFSRQDSSPVLTRAPSHGYQGRPKDHYNPYSMPSLSPVGGGDDRPRRTSTMGPPPLPLPPGRDGGRQAPPHLSTARPPLPAFSQAEGRHPPALNLNVGPPPAAGAPVLSPLSSAVSPTTSEKPLQPSALPLVDLDEVRKAAMHSAAERARLRRQQEEEEREREKERARKKAAELEAKMRSEEEQMALSVTFPRKEDIMESQVIEMIEEAVQTATQGSDTRRSVQSIGGEVQPPSPRPAFTRAPSSRGAPRLNQSRRTSFPASGAGQDVPSLATEVDSWRSKAPRRQSTSRSEKPATPTGPFLPQPLLTEVDVLTVQSNEDLEVVDFSDLGKFVGIDHAPASEAAQNLASRPSRPVAADFFESSVPSVADRPRQGHDEEGSWRRKSIQQYTYAIEMASSGAAAEALKPQITPDAPKVANISAPASAHDYRASDESIQTYVGIAHPSSYHHASQRSPLTPSYREASMSTLNDVLSRIKGALDDMHVKPEPPTHQKWLPPALRTQSRDVEQNAPGEVFDVTGYEPPRSPKPAWKVYSVKVPRDTRSLRPITKQQSQMLHKKPLLWSEVFSWSPPSGASTPSDVLFPLLSSIRGPIRYRVALPRHRPRSPPNIKENTVGLIVNLPPKSGAPRLSPSNSRIVDTSSSWRRASPLSVVKAPHPELDTVSRSPPPEAPLASSTGTSLPKVGVISPQSTSDASPKPRSQPKMPVGSEVAFYRDARVDPAAQSKVAVNFIVTSELEDGSQSAVGDAPGGAAAQAKIPPVSLLEKMPEDGTGSLPLEHSHVEDFVPSVMDSKVDPETTSLPPERAVITPPPHATSSSRTKSPKAFPKESPSRAPDPEHLKALWSQTSNKAELPSINSLEGIADDLTAVPFTLHEVKSEDGGTPPPSGPGLSSRMSSLDVTRAFQQVPPSSTNSPLRSSTIPPISSPPNGAAARPNHPYLPAMSNSNLRTPYAYPSPMLGHAPSPTVMYPHMTSSPAPRPMMVNGPPSPYAQPMWMPVQGPTGQPPGTMMRSPYPAQLMPYPSPGTPVYGPPPGPAGLQNGSAQQSNGAPNRGPAMPMMSPIMQPAHAGHPIYANSPVMLHSPSLVPVPPGHGYPVNRGQMRGAYDSGLPVASPSAGHPPQQHHPGPYTVAPNAFTRPSW
ncbi:uncharacterized protein FIBRA_03706 [Fibroporia radiculosa]|uniref:Uncharacterized protein n=1 Tax=Fibroporia radiculosa TaxID=599839 RepID=J4GNM4_9APHY|nr:uncharacterized protein FIBRA_03706 [Fibroporia radiculosa]CCM01645.1 predicted protein [Fibroporia radiculosa]